MKKYYPVDFDEKGNAVLGTPKNTPTSNGFIPTTWTPGGSGEGNGIKSITITPAITTTPALDSLFPIYYEDLTEEEKESGKQIVAQVGSAISAGDQFAVTVTPTSNLYAAMYDDEHGYHQGEAAGEPVTLTLTAQSQGGMVGLPIACAVSESVDADALFNATIILAYQA